MQHTTLLENVLSNIFLNSNPSSFEDFANTSKLIQRASVKLQQDEYQYKLMLEKLLGMDIPMSYNKWRESYQFVLAIGSNVNLLFTKDVFHAQLGTLLVVDQKKALEYAVKFAELKTIEYLMHDSSLAYNALWNTDKLVDIAIYALRQDVALYIIEDERCFTDKSRIESVMYDAAECGLSNVFFYLLDAYPNRNLNQDMSDILFGHVCASGARDIADYLISTYPGALQDSEIRDGYKVLDIIEGHDDLDDIKAYTHTLQTHGHINRLVTPNINYGAIGQGIRNGRITDIEVIKPIIRNQDSVYILLADCINTLNGKRDIGVNNLAIELFKMLDNEGYIKISIRAAKDNGKVVLAKEFIRLTKQQL